MFEDVSGLIQQNHPGLHYGAAVVMPDGARACMAVAGFGGPNRLLAFRGGMLHDVAPPELADEGRQGIAVAAGDLDGDGREELYVLNTDTFSGPKGVADRLFKRLPDHRWEDLFERPANAGARNLAAGRSVAVIDRRGVGRYGFFVANHGRPMQLYELAPGGAIADIAPALELARTAGGRGVLALPLFSPHPDIFCANEHGANFAFRNRGNGTFEDVAFELGLADYDEHGRGVAAVDAGGEFALAWGNWDGPNRLMALGDRGRWADRATPSFAFPSAVRTVIAADFDNDGNDEIFFNNMGEPNRLFRLEVGTPSRDGPDRSGHAAMRSVAVPLGSRHLPEVEQWTFARRSPGPDERHCTRELTLTLLDVGAAQDAEGYGTGATVCDIDGDGVLELLVARGEKGPQPLGLFKARSPYPNWLRVRPLTRFGAPARGAVVRAEYGGRVRMKGICGGSGYLCQMEPVAHFGLGELTAVERVTVTWPDGAAVALLNPGGNKTVVVPYPRG